MGGVDDCGLMALGWVRLGGAPGHGNGAKGRLTDWLHGWFDLVFTLPPHLIFPHLYSTVWLRQWEHCVYVACARAFASVCTQWIHMCAYVLSHQGLNQWLWQFSQEHSSTFIHCFSSASSMSLPSLVLTSAHVHTLASACDSEQMFLQCMKAMLLYFNLWDAQCFLNAAEKQVPVLCLLKIVHWWTNLTLLPVSSLPLFLVSFSVFFLTVWNTTLCEIRKTQRYPLFCLVFFLYINLFYVYG